jgi:predicted RNase H-like HicB family nuclease
MLNYPVAIESGNDKTSLGVLVPDLPGCFSAGDTLDEAIAQAEEAACAWIDATLDAGGTVPSPSSLESLRVDPRFSGWTFALIRVDPSLLDDTVERVNITLPRRVLKRLDTLAKSVGESRSGYIARMTVER